MKGSFVVFILLIESLTLCAQDDFNNIDSIKLKTVEMAREDYLNCVSRNFLERWFYKLSVKRLSFIPIVSYEMDSANNLFCSNAKFFTNLTLNKGKILANYLVLDQDSLLVVCHRQFFNEEGILSTYFGTTEVSLETIDTEVLYSRGWSSLRSHRPTYLFMIENLDNYLWFIEKSEVYTIDLYVGDVLTLAEVRRRHLLDCL